MEVLEAIDKRHCVREFSSREPDDSLITGILEAAIRAPNAGNLQPWHFYVVTDQAARQKLAKAALSQQHVAAAPVVIVVCADPEVSAAKYGRRGKGLYYIQDCAAATQNLLLAATDKGLSGCWVGAFDEGDVARIIGSPRGRRPLAIIPIGYEAEKKGPSSRLPLHDVTTYIG